MATPAGDRSLLLFVCHGNICRSPMAESLARREFDTDPMLSRARVDVASAGTHARAAHPMHAGAAAVLGELGLAGTEAFRSRALSEELVAAATVILTATRRQRGICVELSPAAVRRTFTLRQFRRLAEALPDDCLAGVEPERRLRALLSEVAGARGQLQSVSPDLDDLDDPVRGTMDDMRACARRIQRVLRPVLALVGAA